MTQVLILLIVVLSSGLLLRWLRAREEPAERIRVELNEDRVTLVGPGMPPRSLRLSELSAVDIFTTDQGPFVEDVFWMLTPISGDPLVVPSGAEGNPMLLDRLLELDGFDAECVVAAAGSHGQRILSLRAQRGRRISTL